ncbi:MAG: glycoside hydrolase family 43 protein [Anaerolineae bacterium]|nr:glycoside hydrolase family 43 protein [Anaerolineae bacterium]
MSKLVDTRRLMIRLTVLISLWLVVAGFQWLTPVHALACTFRNPLLLRGQDPSVVYQDGYYYLVQSNNGHITIQKSALLTELGRAQPVIVFTPPPGQPYSWDMWAPELAYIDGRWYIYVAADDAPGNNTAHRMYVLQANTADPQGSWTMRGRVYTGDPATDKWAIDGSVFTYNGQLYMVWSGWPGDIGDFPQNLYIARMSDPLTISTVRSLISQPDQSWERSVQPIQEGPEAFIHNGQMSIVYSADASWTPAYKLGMLKLTGDDPLRAESWTKIGPIFQRYADASGSVYAPGHNSPPIPSPDFTEDWLVYATKTSPSHGWADRDVRAQPFRWNADNTPNFDHPLPLGQVLPVPSGQPCNAVTF